MESCTGSNVGERALETSQGDDDAKSDPRSEPSSSAEAQVRGGGKCTPGPAGGCRSPSVFSLVRQQPYDVARIVPYNETETDTDSFHICFRLTETPNVPLSLHQVCQIITDIPRISFRICKVALAFIFPLFMILKHVASFQLCLPVC